ncbi:hypothetical protein ACEN4E_09415 [Latilactobacillus sakei]|uniref:hypothetical protein n=1 Tax=Latilactobacillus sakei TaxID=1599 RepID=UPI00388A42FF
MNRNKKSFLLKLLVRMLGKGRLLEAGQYQPYKVVEKYGNRSIELPKRYKILIIKEA